MINLTWYHSTVRFMAVRFTFDFVAERASLELVKNDLAWKSLGRRRLLGEDFLRDEGAGDAERRGSEGSDEVGEGATVWVGGGGGAAVEKAVVDDVGGGACGGERSEQNRGYPSHGVASEIWLIRDRSKSDLWFSLCNDGLDRSELEGFMWVSWIHEHRVLALELRAIHVIQKVNSHTFLLLLIFGFNYNYIFTPSLTVMIFLNFRYLNVNYILVLIFSCCQFFHIISLDGYDYG